MLASSIVIICRFSYHNYRLNGAIPLWGHGKLTIFFEITCNNLPYFLIEHLIIIPVSTHTKYCSPQYKYSRCHSDSKTEKISILRGNSWRKTEFQVSITRLSCIFILFAKSLADISNSDIHTDNGPPV